ncbi:MAG: SDR family oxidoreductase [Synergistales bacterium]|nr:SDR family oxidoreductase [Synergistales bacterium]
MELGLKGKTALVTAASSGLGRSIATAFAGEGANVMLCSRSEEKLEIARWEIQRETGVSPAVKLCDVTDADAISELVAETADRFGGIHILVNNAGGPPAGYFDDFGDEEWQNAFELNLLSYVRTIRAVLPHMRQAKWGRIVNSTSSSVKQVIDHLLLSNTFRLGVVGMSKTLSRQVAKDNILVNVIGPGRFATERVAHLDRLKAERTGKSLEEIKEASRNNIPLGRYGDPTEYARLALFLCSEANTYITGQTVLADGGMVSAL